MDYLQATFAKRSSNSHRGNSWGNHEPVTSEIANLPGNSKCHTREIHGQEIHGKTMNLKLLYRKVLIHAGEIHGDTMNLQNSVNGNAKLPRKLKCHTKEFHGQEFHGKTINLELLYRKVIIHAGEIHGDTMNLQVL